MMKHPFQLILCLRLVLFSPLFALAEQAGSPVVHVFSEPGVGSVNSFIIEGEEGLVIIDTQRALSQGRALAEMASEREKPLLAVLLTHPHPDHFGGLQTVLEAFPGTPVYASDATQEEMRTDGRGFMTATQRALPEDTPAVFPLPDHSFANREILRFGDIVLHVHEIGAGESVAMSMFYLQESNQLFVGDLICYRMIAFLLEDRLDAWIDQLALVRVAYARTAPQIMPGHGDPGPFDQLHDWQTAYLSYLSSLLADAKADGAVETAEFERITESIEAAFPGLLPVAAIPNLLELNLQTLAK